MKYWKYSWYFATIFCAQWAVKLIKTSTEKNISTNSTELVQD